MISASGARARAVTTSRLWLLGTEKRTGCDLLWPFVSATRWCVSTEPVWQAARAHSTPPPARLTRLHHHHSQATIAMTWRPEHSAVNENLSVCALRLLIRSVVDALGVASDLLLVPFFF